MKTIAIAVLTLFQATACKTVDCGDGTIERSGSCVPADDIVDPAVCGPFTELVGGQCVPTFPPTVCDDTSTAGEIDNTTGVTTCIGTAAGFACPQPAPGKMTICGQLFDLETGTPFSDPGAQCTPCAAPTATGVCSVGIRPIDAVKFALNPMDPGAGLASGTLYLDDCGRFKVPDITIPTANPFVGLGIDDADMAKQGPAGTTNIVGLATPKAADVALKDFEAFVAPSTTTTKWAQSGGPTLATGMFVAIFRAMRTGFTNQAGVTILRNGQPIAADDFYFQPSQATRATIEPTALATGANGTALVYPARQAVRRGARPAPRRVRVGRPRRHRLARRRVRADLPSHQRGRTDVPALRSLAVVALLATSASADPTSGVDGALFRSAYDSNGIFSVEGARLLPKHDLSLRVLVGYAKSPVDVAVPGIGDAGDDRVLDYLMTLDMAFGITLTDRVALGIDVAAYRTRTDDGYGTRGRYMGGGLTAPSTGLIALRRISNIDPSANPDDASAYQGDGLAGPLDARLGLKLALIDRPKLAVTVVGSLVLPFGEDEMLLGDRNLVFEPKLALEYRPSRLAATRVVANAGLRIRQRTILESYDTADPAQTAADAKVFLDVGSELVAGVGGVLELAPRAHLAAEAQLFVPLPESMAWGDCRRFDGARCSSLASADYFGDAKQGDLTALVTAGAMLRISADVTANLMVGTGQLGARGDDLRITTGLVWAPQPVGAAVPGKNDRDGDGIPDSLDACRDEAEDKDGYQDEDGCIDADNDGDGIVDTDDACPNEPEDKDGFEDTDGCPERDNDGDGLADTVDRCPDQPEDKDGFEDEDGCPDEDNDGDGFADAKDKCPNDPETVNGVDDDDGCPDVRGTSGPEERADRIDLKGATVAFGRANAVLTAQAKQQLTQVAAIIKQRKLTIRVEVHVALGTKSTQAAAIIAQRKKDKTLAQQRGKAILDYLSAQGVTVQQLQAVGLGSDRPLGTSNPTDAANERVDFIKAQQGGAP
jgi:outer membrane protein OmpA-like peptidoglycan-associated protein